MRRKLIHPIIIMLILVGVPFIIASIYVPNFPISPPDQRAINRQIGRRAFNFATWEIAALRVKIESALVGGTYLLEQPDRVRLVADYLQLVREVKQLEGELEDIFAREADGDTASADLQQTLATKRANMRSLQPTAEHILQTQVGEALSNAGFELLDGTWPPVQAHMTPLPLMLIVSPRDDIRQLYAFPLKHGLPTPERDVLENQIFDEHGLSALVVPIGGLGIYPSMIIESSNIVFLTDVFAHEWAHHWLTLQPLGRNYATTSELRTINETTASIVGREIGLDVLKAHYPDSVPPPPVVTEDPDDPAPNPPDPPAFDFRAEMRETRIRVDELLVAGNIAEAENYMEQRRLVFVENGYLIRKLNQAYFAFHGAYADEGGATGADPVGPTVLAVREQSATLREFLDTMAPITSFEALQAISE